jgi:hypothetical protein
VAASFLPNGSATAPEPAALMLLLPFLGLACRRRR